MSRLVSVLFFVNANFAHLIHLYIHELCSISYLDNKTLKNTGLCPMLKKNNVNACKMNSSYSMPDTRCSMLDARCQMLDTGCSIVYTEG